MLFPRISYRDEWAEAIQMVAESLAKQEEEGILCSPTSQIENVNEEEMDTSISHYKRKVETALILTSYFYCWNCPRVVFHELQFKIILVHHMLGLEARPLSPETSCFSLLLNLFRPPCWLSASK